MIKKWHTNPNIVLARLLLPTTGASRWTRPTSWKSSAMSPTRTSSLLWDTVHQAQPTRVHTRRSPSSRNPACPIRKLVTPTDGAKAGDRVRYIQFTDSMYNAPCQPYLRSYLEAYRFRGIDPGTLSGRQIIECRERDLEKYAKDLVNTELFDPALTGIRGCTVHGHSLRLDENGMMFDMLQRCVLDKKAGIVKYVKDQVGDPLDSEVKVGKPMDTQVAQGTHHHLPLTRGHCLP